MAKRGSMKKQRGCSMKGGLAKMEGGNCATKPMNGGEAKLMDGGEAKLMEGGDASTHAERVYGAVGQQGAAPGGNLIATHLKVGGYRHGRRNSSKSKKGGKKSAKRGGTGLLDMVVPAALVYGQQRYTRRASRRR